MKRILALGMAAWLVAGMFCGIMAEEPSAGDGKADPAKATAPAEGKDGGGAAAGHGAGDGQGKDGGAAEDRYSNDLANYLATQLGALGDDLLPDSVANWLKEKLDKYSPNLAKAAREALIKEACEKLPGDKSKAAFKKLIEDWDTKKDSKEVQADIDNLLKDVIRDEVEQALADSGLGKKEADLVRQVMEDVLTEDIQNISGKIEGDVKDYVCDKIKEELGEDSAKEVGELWDMIRDEKTWEDGNGWDHVEEKIGDAAEAVAWDTLGKLIDRQLERWSKQSEVAKELIAALGINGKGIAGGIKNIWGVISGNGTLEEKFNTIVKNSSAALTEMARNAVQYGLQKLKGWLSKIAKQWCDKALKWVSAKLKEWLGFKIPESALNAFEKLADKAIAKAGQKIVDLGTSISEVFLGSDTNNPPKKKNLATPAGGGSGGGAALIEGSVTK